MIDAPEQPADEVAADQPAPILGELVVVSSEAALPQQPAWIEGLSDKQRAFVEEYLSNGFNAAAAAKEVGYSESYGATLRRDARVLVAIEGAMRESGLARQRILAEVGALAFSSLDDVIDVTTGKIRDRTTIPEAALRSVTRVKIDPDTGKVIEVGTDLRGPALNALLKALRIVGPDNVMNVSADRIVVNLSKEDQAVL